MDTTDERRWAACLQAQAMEVTGMIETVTWEDLNRMDDALNATPDDELQWLDTVYWDGLRADIATTLHEVFPEGIPPFWLE